MTDLSLILALYAIIGALATALTVISNSHKTQNVIAIILPACFLALTVYTLMFAALPSYGLGGNYFLIDHLSLYEILIAATLFLLAAIYSRQYVQDSIFIHEMTESNLKLYYVAFNVLLTAVVYAFLADNLALFWILTELTTAFSAILIVMLNAPKNIGSTLKYIFITSTCMLFAFIGLILIFTLTEDMLGIGTLNWSMLMSIAGSLSPAIMFAAFMFTFVGFAAKSGLVPFHAWLPSAYSKAPGPISAILSGTVTTIGIYGILRMYTIVAQTEAVTKISVFLIVFGIISMVVAALTMLRQPNLKKLIGYSSIEHMGFILVAIGISGISTSVALFWVIFHLLAHGLTKSSLFFSAGILHHQFGSVRIEKIKNVFQVQPFAGWTLILGTISIIGMPLSAIFLSKISILIQSAAVSPVLLIVLLTVFLFAAAAFGIFMIKLLSRKEDSIADVKPFHVGWSMKIPIIVLLVAVFALGVFFPQQLTDLINTIVSELRVG
jgi:hydrogenase-4 component F